MARIIRLTESDLYRLVKRVIREQQESEEMLKERIKKTFGITSFCQVDPKKNFPYNDDVKKLQQIYIKQNVKSYRDYTNGEKLIADGILGPRTLGILCPR